MCDINQLNQENGHGDFVVPKYFNFSVDIIDDWAKIEKAGERCSVTPALWWINGSEKEVKWSFMDVSSNSNRAANVLSKEANVIKGDRVVVILPRIPEYFLLATACLRTGSVFVPFPIGLGTKELCTRLLAVKPSCIVTWSSYLEQLSEGIDKATCLIPELKSQIVIGNCTDVKLRNDWVIFDESFEKASSRYETVRTLSSDPAQIYFSSGTTGNAKMIEHSHGSLGLGSAGIRKDEFEFIPDDLVWCCSSTGWMVIMNHMFAAWSVGAGIFVHFEINPKALLNTLQCYPITSIWLMPSMYALLVLEDLKSCRFLKLNHCASGGELINPKVMVLWKEATELDIKVAYGQTETQRLSRVSKAVEVHLGSVGTPLPGIRVTIIDEQGKEVPPGVQGQIAIRVKPDRPVGMFTRYVDNPEKTSAVFQGEFYLTGDLGRRNEDGYLWVDCRMDDTIFNDGDMINPVEVENCLKRHPAVLEAVVVSSPPPDYLHVKEVPKAFVVLSFDFKDQDNDQMIKELQDHVTHNTADWMTPHLVEFVKDIPRTVTGKVSRKELRKREWTADKWQTFYRS